MYQTERTSGAKLLAHHPQEAALEFQKIIDHLCVVANEPFSALFTESISTFGERASSRMTGKTGN